MTAQESERVMESKQLQCIPCLVWARAGNMPLEHVANLCAYDHKKSGNIRRGHKFGFASCDWHHQGYPSNGWNTPSMRRYFGPSLMDGSKTFAQTYGSDDELIALQNEILGIEEPA
jgi:hypothetical protein